MNVPKTDGPLNIEWHDPHGYLSSEEAAELISRVTRLAASNVPHRLVTRFDFVNGQLGVHVALERRRLGRWRSVRGDTWIPLTTQTNALFSVLLYFGEHGRLPAPAAPRAEMAVPSRTGFDYTRAL